MPRYILDTDQLTLFQHGHILVGRRAAMQPAGAVVISVVTVEETLRGRLASLARASDGLTRIHQYAVLEQTLRLFTQFSVVPYDDAAEVRFQQLRTLRIGTRDLKIASIALVRQSILVTRNRRDFGQVPGLVLEDWSV